MICLASAKRRDTLVNIRETREFVVNLAGTGLSDKVIPTARFTPPEVDEFIDAGLEEKPSVIIGVPGVAGCYAWMECELFKEYEESDYVLIMGKVLRLEVDEQYLTVDGTLDIRKANPLMMIGSRKGMHFCTAADTDRFEPFGAMFPDGKDPMAAKYEG
jgi:flavin reductase (DIM6/NTAB) family NADH-FMN oxidoreductase RutF